MHGIQEFDRNIRVIFPANVGTANAELWGGGGGASGAFARAAFVVNSGTTYLLH